MNALKNRLDTELEVLLQDTEETKPTEEGGDVSTDGDTDADKEEEDENLDTDEEEK